MEDKKKKTSKRLTPQQWNDLLQMLKSGHYTQKELSERYGVSVNSIIRMRKKHGGIAIAENATATASLGSNKLSGEISRVVAYGIEEAERLMNETRRTTSRRLEMFGKVIEMRIAQGIREGNLASIESDVKVIGMAINAQATILEKMSKCLGFKDGEYDTQDSLPELRIEKMSDKEILDVQQQSLDDPLELAINGMSGDEEEDDYEEGEF